MKISVKTDISDFKEFIVELHAKVSMASITGITAVMEAEPTVPVESGHLRDHHEILPTTKVGSNIVGTMKVPGPYAASIHEGISRWGTAYNYKTPGTGAKWIQSKMLRYREKYVAIAGSVTKGSL